MIKMSKRWTGCCKKFSNNFPLKSTFFNLAWKSLNLWYILFWSFYSFSYDKNKLEISLFYKIRTLLSILKLFKIHSWTYLTTRTLLYLINVQDRIKCAGWKIQPNFGIWEIWNWIVWTKNVFKYILGQKWPK